MWRAQVADIEAYGDPDLFLDDDGKLYVAFGCSCTEATHIVQLDPADGWKEVHPRTHPQTSAARPRTLPPGRCNAHAPACRRSALPRPRRQVGERVPLARGNATLHGWETRGDNNELDGTLPYIEGSWMNKVGGRYYYQYSAPGTQFKSYGSPRMLRGESPRFC